MPLPSFAANAVVGVTTVLRAAVSAAEMLFSLQPASQPHHHHQQQTHTPAFPAAASASVGWMPRAGVCWGEWSGVESGEVKLSDVPGAVKWRIWLHTES